MWEAELPRTIEALARQASTLRVSLQRSQGNTEKLATALDSFDRCLAALKDTMQERGHATQMADGNIVDTIDVTDVVLSEYEITPRDEATKEYLKAVGTLKGAADCLLSDGNFKSWGRFRHEVNTLLSKSVLIIEEEFKRLMSTHSKAVKPDCLLDCLPKPQRASRGEAEAGGGNSTHSEDPSKSLETAIYRIPTLLPPRISELLNVMFRRLVQAGNQQSCYRIYRDARSSSLKKTLHKLGVEKLCKCEVQKMQWEALNSKIGSWTQLMRIMVNVLLPGERKICDQVFCGSSFNKDQHFAELAKTGFLDLLNFGDVVAKREASPQKMFALLEMYEVMQELKSEIEITFKGKCCSKIREASLGLMKQLAEKTRPCPAHPEEIIDIIVSKVPLCRASLTSLSCVNKQWNAAVQSQLLKISYPSLVLPCSRNPLFHASIGCDKWHRMNLPQDVRLHGRFCGSSDGGWVAIALEEPHRHQLVNLNNTNQRVNLPITAEVSYEEKKVKLLAAVPSSSPLNPHCNVAAIIEAEGIDPPGIAIWTKGMDHWNIVECCPDLSGNVQDIIFFRDAFHFITETENLGVFFPDTGDEWKTEMVRVETRSGFNLDATLIDIHGYRRRLYLVESDDNLFLVIKLVHPHGGVQTIRVLKLEVDGDPEDSDSDDEHHNFLWLNASGLLQNKVFFVAEASSSSFQTGADDLSRLFFLDDDNREVAGSPGLFVRENMGYVPISEEMEYDLIETWPEVQQENGSPLKEETWQDVERDDPTLPSRSSDKFPPCWWIP